LESRNHVDRGWIIPRGRAGRFRRVVLVAVAYSAFGVFSLAVAATAVPAIHLVARDRDRAERRIQRLLQRLFRTYLKALEVMGIARFRCTGARALAKPGTLVVANHPTRLDAIALISFMPQADCIMKRAYFENPFLARVVRAAGYIPHSGGQAVVDACAQRLLRGRSVLIFPEGTRSPYGGLAPLQRGAAHVALQSGCDLVPVTMRCEPPALGKGEPWWKVPEEPFELSLEVGSPIRVKEVVSNQPTRARAARALTEAIREHFETKVGSGG
jgi:1-acyl-sn-glycerol-3-phosphate acyltransferase